MFYFSTGRLNLCVSKVAKSIMKRVSFSTLPVPVIIFTTSFTCSDAITDGNTPITPRRNPQNPKMPNR